ncbi:MAG: hypothetical protein L3J67_11835 [Hyphomicrobiaceae bacterium]|nr:hypothetical protein [Hyphomicrobiaceae bacterium]
MAHSLKTLLLTGLFSVFASSFVLADQINGNWCAADGRTISIDGPHVTTPAGNTVLAIHGRHHIDYLIPENETDAGHRFTADQLDDERISVQIIDSKTGQRSPAQIWVPCKPTA